MPRWALGSRQALRATVVTVVALMCLSACSERIAYQGDLPTLQKALGNSPEYFAFMKETLKAKISGTPPPEATPAIVAEREHARAAYALLGDYVLAQYPQDADSGELVYDIRRSLRHPGPDDGVAFYFDNWSEEGRVAIRVDGHDAIINGANSQVLDYLRYQIANSPILHPERRP